jgi:hypothetical protein
MTISFTITGLHNKPQGYGASVASAAGPFVNKNKKNTYKVTRNFLEIPGLDVSLDTGYIDRDFRYFPQFFQPSSRVAS